MIYVEILLTNFCLFATTIFCDLLDINWFASNNFRRISFIQTLGVINLTQQGPVRAEKSLQLLSSREPGESAPVRMLVSYLPFSVST